MRQIQWQERISGKSVTPEFCLRVIATTRILLHLLYKCYFDRYRSIASLFLAVFCCNNSTKDHKALSELEPCSLKSSNML